MTLEKILGKEEANTVALVALSPLDGRYSDIADELRDYFSEYALIKYRLKVEIAWIGFLLDNVADPAITEQRHIYMRYKEQIKPIANDFSLEDAKHVKEIEKKVGHDVRALEIFIVEKIKKLADGLERPMLTILANLFHTGISSEDVNNIAYALMIRDARKEVYGTAVNILIDYLGELALKYKSLPMLARVHGQAAIPTTLGKEFEVYHYRLKKLLDSIDEFDIAKCNGSIGNYSALNVTFQNNDWISLNKGFVESLELKYNPVTTQIESHDGKTQLLKTIQHINMIILNLDVDMCMYMNNGIFKQLNTAGTTVSEKQSLIKFENSEGNCYMSNGLINGITEKLLRTRWQRDLSDSTAQRNIGAAMGYSLQAINETLAALKNCIVNEAKIAEEIKNAWYVLEEPVQSILRKYGDRESFDKFKHETQGKELSKDDIYSFVNSLDILSKEDKEILLGLTPSNYIGLAEVIVENQHTN